MMLYILAGNHRQAILAAEWLGLPRLSWRYVTEGAENLRATDQAHVLQWGTWYQRRDLEEVAHVLIGNRAHVQELRDR